MVTALVKRLNTSAAGRRKASTFSNHLRSGIAVTQPPAGMGSVASCEWTGGRCQKTTRPGTWCSAEHHALVFKAPNPGEKRSGIGPLTKESIRRAQARRKVKLGQGEEFVLHLACARPVDPRQLDAIERRYPTDEVRALVAEIRRLNAIVECAGDLVRALEPATLTTTPKLLLTALVERLRHPRRGGRRAAKLRQGRSASRPNRLRGTKTHGCLDTAEARRQALARTDQIRGETLARPATRPY